MKIIWAILIGLVTFLAAIFTICDSETAQEIIGIKGNKKDPTTTNAAVNVSDGISVDNGQYTLDPDDFNLDQNP